MGKGGRKWHRFWSAVSLFKAKMAGCETRLEDGFARGWTMGGVGGWMDGVLNETRPPLRGRSQSAVQVFRPKIEGCK